MGFLGRKEFLVNPEDVKILVDSLIKTGEILATNVFRIAIQQVYVEAVQHIAGALVFIFSAGMSVRFSRKEQDDFYLFFAWIFGVLSVATIAGAIARWMNPEFYAMKILLTTFGIGN